MTDKYNSMEALQNYTLWVGISSRGMPFTTEMEMLHILMEQSQGTIGAQDILSIQRVTTKDPMYIVYCDNSSTKAKILECVCVVVEGREYELIDFQTKNITTFGSSGSRVSIHGILSMLLMDGQAAHQQYAKPGSTLGTIPVITC